MPVTLLILESFGTSEFLLILVVALIFFGPRKLPQLSRQIGKSLAEFRKASEDFKRTWEREVALETVNPEPERNPEVQPQDNLISTTVGRGQDYGNLTDPGYVTQLEDSTTTIQNDNIEVTTPTEPAPSPATPKRDWL